MEIHVPHGAPQSKPDHSHSEVNQDTRLEKNCVGKHGRQHVHVKSGGRGEHGMSTILPGYYCQNQATCTCTIAIFLIWLLLLDQISIAIVLYPSWLSNLTIVGTTFDFECEVKRNVLIFGNKSVTITVAMTPFFHGLILWKYVYIIKRQKFNVLYTVQVIGQ